MLAYFVLTNYMSPVCPSVCPSVRSSAVSHERTLPRVSTFFLFLSFSFSLFRVRGKSRPGPTPFLFSHSGPPVLYFLLHAGIPAVTLYARLLKAASCSSLALLPTSPFPPLPTLAVLSSPPLSFVSLRHTRVGSRVSLSINDFYGLPSPFLFSSLLPRETRTCPLLRRGRRVEAIVRGMGVRLGVRRRRIQLHLQKPARARLIAVIN